MVILHFLVVVAVVALATLRLNFIRHTVLSYSRVFVLFAFGAGTVVLPSPLGSGADFLPRVLGAGVGVFRPPAEGCRFSFFVSGTSRMSLLEHIVHFFSGRFDYYKVFHG